AFDLVTEKRERENNQLLLEHGKPLIFGPEQARKGIRLAKDMSPEIVSLSEVHEAEILVHDERNEALGFFLSRLESPEFPVPLGVVRALEKPCYEGIVADQARQAVEKMGRNDFDKLFRSGDTWTVR
ncbi:MAG: 2-oxoacid:ferredoxin oxidoreductase subunit beta, partial [Candidatus Binatia bacterium]